MDKIGPDYRSVRWLEKMLSVRLRVAKLPKQTCIEDTSCRCFRGFGPS